MLSSYVQLRQAMYYINNEGWLHYHYRQFPTPNITLSSKDYHDYYITMEKIVVARYINANSFLLMANNANYYHQKYSLSTCHIIILSYCLRQKFRNRVASNNGRTEHGPCDDKCTVGRSPYICPYNWLQVGGRLCPSKHIFLIMEIMKIIEYMR